MRHHHRRWKGRARDASAEDLFERALLGERAPHSKSFDPRTDRKTLQLCRQVQRVLMVASGDELLGDLSVESVEPMGGASQLLVRVVMRNASQAAIADAMARLRERSGTLRALVAQSVSRKRTPSLTFVVVPEISITDQGDQP